MKVGIIVCTDDKEICFLAIRYAIFHLMENKDVKVYFVDSGLQYGKAAEKKYHLNKLLVDFGKSGGKFYRSRNRDTLRNRLRKHFRDSVQSRQLDSMCYNDKFQNIITRDVYIRKFI